MRRRSRVRYWSHRFRSRYGSFADALVRVGPVEFHLSRMPSEGWRYRVYSGGIEWELRW